MKKTIMRLICIFIALFAVISTFSSCSKKATEVQQEENSKVKNPFVTGKAPQPFSCYFSKIDEDGILGAPTYIQNFSELFNMLCECSFYHTEDSTIDLSYFLQIGSISFYLNESLDRLCVLEKGNEGYLGDKVKCYTVEGFSQDIWDKTISAKERLQFCEARTALDKEFVFDIHNDLIVYYGRLAEEDKQKEFINMLSEATYTEIVDSFAVPNDEFFKYYISYGGISMRISMQTSQDTCVLQYLDDVSYGSRYRYFAQPEKTYAVSGFDGEKLAQLFASAEYSFLSNLIKLPVAKTLYVSFPGDEYNNIFYVRDENIGRALEIFKDCTYEELDRIKLQDLEQFIAVTEIFNAPIFLSEDYQYAYVLADNFSSSSRPESAVRYKLSGFDVEAFEALLVEPKG